MAVFSSCKSLAYSSIKVYEEDLLLSLISDIPESPAHSTFHGRRQLYCWNFWLELFGLNLYQHDR